MFQLSMGIKPKPLLFSGCNAPPQTMPWMSCLELLEDIHVILLVPVFLKAELE